MSAVRRPDYFENFHIFRPDSAKTLSYVLSRAFLAVNATKIMISRDKQANGTRGTFCIFPEKQETFQDYFRFLRKASFKMTIKIAGRKIFRYICHAFRGNDILKKEVPF